ncbi:MAG: bifunctional UDP-N-acetylglucosamine diphosphorylase/glucosamine-1-phosphate N-acetyltransferase GlmU [Pseudomonadota bacterium]
MTIENSGTDGTFLAVVLAAGQGTRMRSTTPKVLHEIAGRSMLAHVMVTARAAGAARTVVVTSPAQDDVRAHVEHTDPDATTVIQHEQHGTAHAVLSAAAEIEAAKLPVLVLYGDTPLVRAVTLSAAVDALEDRTSVVVVGFEAEDPTDYGRLLVHGDTDRSGHTSLERIVEHADATAAERAVTFCNSGIVGLRASAALPLLKAVTNDNAKGEYYLTDVVEGARTNGDRAAVVAAQEDAVRGVNSRAQLAEVEAIWQARRRVEVMESGVTMLAPDTVTLAFDTKIASDVVIEPNVYFAPGVTVEAGARLRAFSYFEAAHIGRDAIVGPYARLRPETRLGEKVRVGNFVEIKKADVASGAKVNHLSYIGDADVGTEANIGAGTITCNYDGFAKHKTTIGPRAFIGSNSALVAPVTIGEDGYVGSGSVVTKNVSAGALAVTRAPQVEKAGWVEKFRTLMSRKAARRV